MHRKFTDNACLKKRPKQLLWARLFKTIGVVSERFVKISNVNIWNMPLCFVEEKCEKAFAVQMLCSFSQQKYLCICI